MDIFWKTASGLLVASILVLTVDRREIAVLLAFAACVMGAAAAVSLLRPVFDLLQELERIGNLDRPLVSVLLRASGIVLTAEIAASVCRDSGSSSLGNTLQLAGTAAVLCLSVPIFQALLELIRGIMGEF